MFRRCTTSRWTNHQKQVSYRKTHHQPQHTENHDLLSLQIPFCFPPQTSSKRGVVLFILRASIRSTLTPLPLLPPSLLLLDGTPCAIAEVMPRAACAHGPAIIRHRWPPLGRKRRTADLVPRWVGISWVVGRRLKQVVD